MLRLREGSRNWADPGGSAERIRSTASGDRPTRLRRVLAPAPGSGGGCSVLRATRGEGDVGEERCADESEWEGDDHDFLRLRREAASPRDFDRYSLQASGQSTTAAAHHATVREYAPIFAVEKFGAPPARPPTPKCSTAPKGRLLPKSACFQRGSGSRGAALDSSARAEALGTRRREERPDREPARGAPRAPHGKSKTSASAGAPCATRSNVGSAEMAAPSPAERRCPLTAT